MMATVGLVAVAVVGWHGMGSATRRARGAQPWRGSWPSSPCARPQWRLVCGASQSPCATPRPAHTTHPVLRRWVPPRCKRRKTDTFVTMAAPPGGVDWQAQQAALTPTLLPGLRFHDLVFGRDLGAGAFGTVRYARSIMKGTTQVRLACLLHTTFSSCVQSHRLLSSPSGRNTLLKSLV